MVWANRSIVEKINPHCRHFGSAPPTGNQMPEEAVLDRADRRDGRRCKRSGAYVPGRFPALSLLRAHARTDRKTQSRFDGAVYSPRKAPLTGKDRPARQTPKGRVGGMRSFGPTRAGGAQTFFYGHTGSGGRGFGRIPNGRRISGAGQGRGMPVASRRPISEGLRQAREAGSPPTPPGADAAVSLRLRLLAAQGCCVDQM